MHHLTGPLIGNLIVIGVAGIITLGSFVAMFWILLYPGETGSNHPKRTILRDDR